MLGIWKPPTRSWTRLQKMPRMASTEPTTTRGVVRSFGTKQIAAHRMHPTISVQKNGAKGPATSMETTSAPEPFGKALVKRSHPKKYRSTQTNAPSILASFTMFACSTSR